jgi:hypothetical protein
LLCSASDDAKWLFPTWVSVSLKVNTGLLERVNGRHVWMQYYFVARKAEGNLLFNSKSIADRFCAHYGQYNEPMVMLPH